MAGQADAGICCFETVVAPLGNFKGSLYTNSSGETAFRYPGMTCPRGMGRETKPARTCRGFFTPPAAQCAAQVVSAAGGSRLPRQDTKLSFLDENRSCNYLICKQIVIGIPRGAWLSEWRPGVGAIVGEKLIYTTTRGASVRSRHCSGQRRERRLCA